MPNTIIQADKERRNGLILCCNICHVLSHKTLYLIRKRIYTVQQMSKIEGLLQSMLIGFDKKVERLFINILQKFTKELDLKYKNYSQNENTTNLLSINKSCLILRIPK